MRLKRKEIPDIAMKNEGIEGILLVNKPRGITSFDLVRLLRKILGVQKIGHAGTLDPFATGVMVMLIGRGFTKLSETFLSREKEYRAQVCLGTSTDSFDCEGKITKTSPKVPQLSEIMKALEDFQGKIWQTPPMFSAKKIKGKKLYNLARKGQEVERKAVEVEVCAEVLSYQYPYLDLKIRCSKGTYIRSIAHELGLKLGCGGHLTALQRVRSGDFRLDDCVDGGLLPQLSRSEIQKELNHA